MYLNAEMVCGRQDARIFIGAVFNDMGTSMARAGLALDRVEDFLEHVAPGSGARAVGHWGGEQGKQLTEQAWQRLDVLDALCYLSLG
eukprot:7725840-Pyramimonas_sp.AAC.1